ncbi:uncharacterized protein LOC129645921 isoform X7 [Bubalus kerabau]|uniref:uncharacterized protein LOC129645921 isoform X7 n=1 Tax=Bubalus carabanensis TaxID=3119969 RepID=UPI00244ED278|nr:uncharacterized protein LOC129645921 isoform X7 [Bubalus carabanensis]
MALTLLQGVMWPEPRTRSSVSMKIRGSVHKTPSPGPGTQWMNTLPSLFSTGYHYFRSLVMKNATVQILCAPLSMGFSRHEYCSGLPCPPPGDLPDPEIEAPSLTSPALTGLQRITSTVTCRPHLAPRLSAAREGVSSSPLPSESWLDSLPPAKKLSLEVSTRLYTTSPPSEGPGQYPAGILTSPPRAPSLRSFPGPLILSAGAQCPPLSP